MDQFLDSGIGSENCPDDASVCNLMGHWFDTTIDGGGNAAGATNENLENAAMETQQQHQQDRKKEDNAPYFKPFDRLLTYHEIALVQFELESATREKRERLLNSFKLFLKQQDFDVIFKHKFPRKSFKDMFKFLTYTINANGERLKNKVLENYKTSNIIKYSNKDLNDKFMINCVDMWYNYESVQNCSLGYITLCDKKYRETLLNIFSSNDESSFPKQPICRICMKYFIRLCKIGHILQWDKSMPASPESPLPMSPTMTTSQMTTFTDTTSTCAAVAQQEKKKGPLPPPLPTLSMPNLVTDEETSSGKKKRKRKTEESLSSVSSTVIATSVDGKKSKKK